VGRTIIWALVLALVGFGVFEWQRNARLESELASIREKLPERDVAQEHSVPSATEREDTKIPVLRRQNDALSNRVNRLETELAAEITRPSSCTGEHEPARGCEGGRCPSSRLGSLRGSEGALNIVLEPQRFGIDVPLASTVGALKPAAQNGNARAIEALAAVAANDGQQPLWYMAADGLQRGGERTRNPTARHFQAELPPDRQSALCAKRRSPPAQPRSAQ
jgi:hypothetical protein